MKGHSVIHTGTHDSSRMQHPNHAVPCIPTMQQHTPCWPSLGAPPLSLLLFLPLASAQQQGWEGPGWKPTHTSFWNRWMCNHEKYHSLVKRMWGPHLTRSGTWPSPAASRAMYLDTRDFTASMSSQRLRMYAYTLE